MHEITALVCYLIFEYLCLNKFCNSGQITLFKGSRDWNHNLSSPSNVRQNFWTFTSLTKWWAFIQSLKCSKCASASSSGFPEDSGLNFDQFMCKCCCCHAGSRFCCCCWICHWFCPCLWLGTAAPSLSFCHFCYSFLILVCCVIWFLTYPTFTSFIHPRCDKFYFSQISTCPWCLNLMIHFSYFWYLRSWSSNEFDN